MNVIFIDTKEYKIKYLFYFIYNFKRKSLGKLYCSFMSIKTGGTRLGYASTENKKCLLIFFLFFAAIHLYFIW